MSKFNNHNFKGQKALIRVDFNVPIKEGKITDDTRIRAALPTIKKVLADGGAVVLMSHWGRPLKDIEKKPHLTLADFTLKPIAIHLANLLSTDVQFTEDCISDDAAQKLLHYRQDKYYYLKTCATTSRKKKVTKNLQKNCLNTVIYM